MTLTKKAIENIVGKGENAGNQHFPTMFLPIPEHILSCHLHLFCHLQMLSIYSHQILCRLVKS